MPFSLGPPRGWTPKSHAWYRPGVTEHDRLYEHIMLRRSDANVPFDGLCALLRRLGFEERVRGDHHIFTMEDVEEILNV